MESSDVECRSREEPLPWCETSIDPSRDYDSGKAVSLVEIPDVPDHRRQSAIAENGSFVVRMKRYFGLSGSTEVRNRDAKWTGTR